jgi:hypothetical protein
MDEEKELTEVPLSNREVLKVLKTRTEQNPKLTEIINYIESIEIGPYKYPLEILRDIKMLSADLNTLATVSNMADLSILNIEDRKKVENHFTKQIKNVLTD